MRNKHIILVLFGLLVLLSACKSKDDKKVLAVSVEPQRALLEAIVGDRFEVVTIMPAEADPESFEPTLKTRGKLEKSAAYFTVGALPFEQKLTESLGNGEIVVDTSKGIVPIFGTHSHHAEHHDSDHHHDAMDPHTWASVKNARIIAKNMYEKVVQIDPDWKTYYTERYFFLDKALDSLDRAFEAQLKNIPNRNFAVWHPSLSYFARDYGLNQIAVGFENKEVSPSAMAQVIDKIRQSGTSLLILQPGTDPRAAKSLEGELRLKTLTINPLQYDWQQPLQHTAKALQ